MRYFIWDIEYGELFIFDSDNELQAYLDEFEENGGEISELIIVEGKEVEYEG